MEFIITFLYAALLIVCSYLLAKLLTPLILLFLRKLSAKTRTNLDDRILNDISGPLDSFSFLFFIVLLTNIFPSLFYFVFAYIERYIVGATIIVTAYLFAKIIGAISRWYYDEGHKTAHIKIDLSLMPFIKKASQLIVLVIGTIIGIGTTGFDITGIVAITSIVGLIIGLASQETLANIFAGLAIQIDRPYHYGDYLRFITGETVRLKKIGMRTTKLIDLEGNLMIISNTEFAKQRVTKISSVRKPAKINIEFEAPISLRPEKIKETLELSRNEIADYIVKDSNIAVNITRIRYVDGHNIYNGKITINIVELSFNSSVTQWVNKKLVELITGTKKNQQKKEK